MECIRPIKISQLKFKASMLKPSLCDYSDPYIIVRETILVTNMETAGAPNNRNKNVIFQNYASSTDQISDINNTPLDNAEGIDVVMPMCN